MNNLRRMKSKCNFCKGTATRPEKKKCTFSPKSIAFLLRKMFNFKPENSIGELLSNMRKLKLYIATSLDGKIARKNGEIDWLPNIDEEDYGYQEFLATIDATVMGYKTYEVCND